MAKKEKDKLQEDKPPVKKKKKGGCCGCLVGTFVTILVLIVALLGVGYFVADNYLTQNFGVGMNDCLSLVTGVYTPNERLVTEGNPTNQDKQNLYEEIADATFVKPDKIEELTSTAIAQVVIPAVDSAINGTQQQPVNLAGEQGAFDWEAYLEQMVADGVVDADRLSEFFNSSSSISQIYDEKFVLQINGKGIVALTDNVINKTLDSVTGLKDFKGLASVRQVKFSDKDGVKIVNLVVQLKLSQFAYVFVKSDHFASMVKNEDVLENRDNIAMLTSILPQNVLASVSLEISDGVSVKLAINGVNEQTIQKWFSLVKNLTGADLQQELDKTATEAYTSIAESVENYFDLKNAIGLGYFNLDLYDVASKVINEQLELQGANALTKQESAVTIANALYANMDVNGNGRQEILTENAPNFAGSNWKEQTKADFVSWLKKSVAFNSNEYTLDQLVAKFTDETGKLAEPQNYAELLQFLDTNYLRSGLAFLKEDLVIDDRFIAYLFEEYKQEIFTTAGQEAFASFVNLEYVRLATQTKSDGEHTYLMIGVSATTKTLLETLGYGEFAFIKSVVGEELFVCAKADVSFDSSITRESTTFSLNGLSEAQTMEIVATVNKIAKENLIDKFIDSYVLQVIEKINLFRADYFNIVVSVNADGNGTILLPSATSMLEVFINETQNKNVDAHAFVDAISQLISSDYAPTKYTAFLSQTNQSLTSNANAYESYEDILINELFADYFIQTQNLDDLIDLLVQVIQDPENAMDVLMGGDNVLITKEYFLARNDFESTKPIIDGHVLACLVEKIKPRLGSIMPQEDLSVLEYVEICDINFYKSQDVEYMDIELGIKVCQLIDVYGQQLGEYSEFVKRLLGGEQASMALELRVSMGETDKININLAGLTDAQMNVIFDTMNEFGITTFDFDNPDNEIVKAVLSIKESVLDFVQIEPNGDTVSLPSVFSIVNSSLINNEEITDVEFFGAIHDLITSTPNGENYNGYEQVSQSALLLSNEGVIGEYLVDQDKTVNQNWQNVIHHAVEQKFLLKNGKTITDVINAIALQGNDRLDALMGSEDGTVEGIMNLEKSFLQEYFTSQYRGATLADSQPKLDGNMLAYLLDTNKQSLDGLIGVDESTSELLGKVSIDKVVIENGILEFKITFSFADLLQSLEGGEDVGALFDIVDDECKTVSLSISKSMDKNNTEPCSIVLNDIASQDLENIIQLLAELGIDYFDTQSEDNVFNVIANSVRDMIDQFMPYDETNGLFTMAGIFGYAGEEIIDRYGAELGEYRTYSLLKSFVLYQEPSQNNDNQQAIADFDAKAREFYYLENGTQSLKNTFNATSNAEGYLTFVTYSNKTTREIIIEDNIGVSVENKTYKRSFIVKESDIAPLVNSLEILSIGNGCYLDGITVIDDDVINIKVILDSSALFGQGSLMGTFARFDVIPQMIAVSMPVSLGETVVSGYKIEGVNETLTGVSESELRALIDRLVKVENTVNEMRSSSVDSIGNVLQENGLKFVYAQDAQNRGLQFPALTELFVDVLNRDENASHTLEQINTLFDDFICLTEFVSEVDIEGGKSHFADHMVENYYMKEEMLPHSTIEEIDATFRKILLALDLVVPDQGESDVDMLSMLDTNKFTIQSVAQSKRVLFGEDEMTAIFSEIADYGQMEIVESHVPFNGAVNIIGNVNLSEFMPDTMSPMTKAFAPEKLSIQIIVLQEGTRSDYEVTVDEDGNQVYYHYEICNLNTYEEGDDVQQKREKTNNLINLFDSFGADIHESDFANFAIIIKDSIEIILEKIVGRSEDNTQDVVCELVHDYENDNDLVADTTITTGVIMPSVVEYARKRNWLGYLLGTELA